MAELSKSETINGTPSATTTTLSQMVTKLLEAMSAGKLGDMAPRASWYRLKVVKDKIWFEVDEQSVPKRDSVLRKLTRKQQNSFPWDMTDIRFDMMGNPLNTLQDVMKVYNLNSSNFHLQLEDGLRKISTPTTTTL